MGIRPRQIASAALGFFLLLLGIAGVVGDAIDPGQSVGDDLGAAGIVMSIALDIAFPSGGPLAPAACPRGRPAPR